ncbi:hypothetical protein C8R46DRAFT_1287726 [Mycena filopes]|nr:hypothetical protein C8R46DRAFT_1287726 [Mycena filopes]
MPPPPAPTILGKVLAWFFGSRRDEPTTSNSGLESKELKSPLNLPLPSHSALHVLNIHCSLLFHTYFYKWTLHTLNTSPLTTLSLANIDLYYYDWALVLPALTLAHLTSLSISDCEMAVPDLALFLARHPIIQTLDLTSHATIGALAHPPAESILPRLATLRAPPDYILYFLLRHGTPCPALRDVTAAWQGKGTDVPTHQVRSFARVVACVACVERRPVVPRLSVSGTLAYIDHCEVPAHLQCAET